MIRTLLVLAGCQGPPVVLEATSTNAGVQVSASRSVGAVEIRDATGALVVRQPFGQGRREAFVAVPLAPGRYRAVGEGAEAWFDVAAPGPVEVEVEAPAGQGRRPVASGQAVAVWALGDAPASAAVVLTAREAGEVRVSGPGVDWSAALVSGQRERVPIVLGDDPLRIEVEVVGVGPRWSVRLEPVRRDFEAARRDLEVAAVAMPTDLLGAVDRARPPDRVSLPSEWWRRVLRQTGLGYRPRDDQAPWTWQTVTLASRAEAPVDLVIRSTVVDERGEVAEAFRPTLRESVGDSVQALVRLPPGRTANVALPIYVDGTQLPGNAHYVRRIDVIPLGSVAPLHRVELPLHVTRGSRWASGWLVAALVASTLGWIWLFVGARRWISSAPTADLVTIAGFGSVTWVAGTALQVAGLGVSAVLGPFAPLLTGLADDALRACLLGTLVALVPRPGTAALATVVGFVMRGLTMGTFHPVDLLYLGSAVFWLELWLWLAGCTRDTGWRDGEFSHWLRLCVGLGVSNVCATATALVVSVVFYRLYFADWYVLLILVFPGFLYVCAGCWPAVGFSRALRRVEG